MHRNSLEQPPVNVIEVKGLSKRYQSSGKSPAKEALKSIDLAIPKGSIFGLLGPNGAGKSTLINILAGLVNKSAGQARIWGYDIDRQRRQASLSIGIVPQELNFDPFFTPYDLLEQQAGFYGLSKRNRRTGEILAILGLEDKARSHTRSLSGGMKRRLMVGKAMVHNPQILVLDEPTAGVDIELRQQLWRYVKSLNQQGTTVLLTTHYLEEAEELCDDIAIINHGEIVACDNKASLMGRLSGKSMVITLDRELARIPPSLANFDPKQPQRRQLAFALEDQAHGKINAIFRVLNREGLSITDITTEQSDLEDIFLQLTRAV